MRLIVIFLFLVAVSLPAQADMGGSADHPRVPRVAGSEIYGYAHSEYDAATMLTEGEPGKLVVRNPEGVRTRILYVAKPGDTPTMVMRNYAVALDELGEVSEIYSCRNNCHSHTFSTTLWTRETMVPTESLKSPFYLLAFTHNYGSAHYRYAEVVTDESKFHVGVFSAVIAGNNPNPGVRHRTVALVEILEIKDFKPTLEFVDASHMQTEIAQTGHVALYGIQFDTNQATLKPESQSTLDEITKALSANPALQLYVVGHTDDEGTLDYNNDLSLRRARTVVEALVAAGIKRNRLTPSGVGPVAPIGSNDDEDGRALNRRVELVKRSIR
jgi:OOP family OmpA-OmpF porin